MMTSWIMRDEEPLVPESVMVVHRKRKDERIREIRNSWTLINGYYEMVPDDGGEDIYVQYFVSVGNFNYAEWSDGFKRLFIDKASSSAKKQELLVAKLVTDPRGVEEWSAAEYLELDLDTIKSVLEDIERKDVRDLRFYWDIWKRYKLINRSDKVIIKRLQDVYRAKSNIAESRRVEPVVEEGKRDERPPEGRGVISESIAAAVGGLSAAVDGLWRFVSSPERVPERAPARMEIEGDRVADDPVFAGMGPPPPPGYIVCISKF